MGFLRDFFPIRCDECGLELEEEMYCPRCGTLNRKEARGSSWPTLGIYILLFLLGMFLLLLVYGYATMEPLPDTDVQNTTITLATPTISNRSIDGQERWDARTNVLKITPKDQSIKWEDLVVVVQLEDGRQLGKGLDLSPDDPSSYDDSDDEVIEIEAWYVEQTGENGTVNAGDEIIITGLKRSFEGSSITLWREGYRQGIMVLDTGFQ